MRNIIIIITILLFNSCGMLDGFKYSVSQSLVKQAIKLSPSIADTSTRQIEFKLPDIIINKQGIIENLSDTIIVRDTFTETITEIKLEVIDSNCKGKVYYDVSVQRDSQFIFVDCPVIELDTTGWKRNYNIALQKVEKYKEASKKRLRIIIILTSLIIGLIFSFLKYKKSLKNEKKV